MRAIRIQESCLSTASLNKLLDDDFGSPSFRKFYEGTDSKCPTLSHIGDFLARQHPKARRNTVARARKKFCRSTIDTHGEALKLAFFCFPQLGGGGGGGGAPRLAGGGGGGALGGAA